MFSFNATADSGGALWRGRRDSDKDPREAAPESHCHALPPVSLCSVPTTIPTAARTNPLQSTVTKSALAHLTDNSHGIPVHRRRAPALRRSRRAWHTPDDPRNQVVWPHLVADRRTYLRRERPPVCVCAIRVAQIRRRTRTSLVRSPSRISTGHLALATPIMSTCKVWTAFCWCALYAECALVVFSYVARPSSRA